MPARRSVRIVKGARVRSSRQHCGSKLEILAEYEGLDRDAKGSLLRREGLYTSLISEWRKQHDRGALEALVSGETGAGTVGSDRAGQRPAPPSCRPSRRRGP